MAKNVLSNPTRALDITADIATAAASRNHKNIIKTLLELIFFSTQVNDCTWVNVYELCYINGPKKT